MDFVTIVLSIGAINGLVLGSILLNIKNANILATRLFALIVFLFALIIGGELTEHFDLDSRNPHIIGLTDGLVLVVSPLLLLYALFITESKKLLSKVDLLHLVPFLVFTIYMIPFYTLSGEEKTINANYDESGLIGLAKAITFLTYFVLSLIHISRHLRNTKSGSRASNNIKNIRWYRGVLLSLIITGLISIGMGFVQEAGYEFLLDSDTVSVLLLSSIFYVNSFVLIKNPFILWGKQDFEFALDQINGNAARPKRRYKTSPLTTDDLKLNLSELMRVMETDRPYLNSELSPEDLEKLTGIKVYYISQTLSEVLNKNFYEFVNAYRVEEAKKLILDSSNDHKTILALGLESGFNSKSSFNRVFKNYTGKTPSQFKRESLN